MRICSVGLLVLCSTFWMPALVKCESPSGLPVRGLHCSAPARNEVDQAARFIREILPAEGVNVLVLEVNYRYQYTTRPEVADPDALSKEDLRKLLNASREAGVRLIPMINCLGHQSWAKTTFGLLRARPEFDETPGKYPDNQGIYCRSYCPLHPDVHAVLFDLIDELASVFEADAFHVGMDEVFLLGENDCSRCRGRGKAELFALEVRTLRDHLAQSKRTLWMWGDRFLEGKVSGMGEWEASLNDTASAIRQVPRDIVICDWHYDQAEPTAAYFALEGFPVLSSPWRKTEVALGQLSLMRQISTGSSPAIAARMQGMLQTTWVGMGAFMNAYAGTDTSSVEATEAARCFKTLFSAIRQAGLR